MTPPVPPFWFVQRQGKMEAAGTDAYRLTAPNMPEAFIAIRPGENGRYASALRLAADGPEVAATDPVYDNTPDAWGAAFELYRNFLVT